MPLSTKTKKYLRYGITAFLLTGVVAVTGFLSFAGMLALTGSIYLGITGFILGGGIEGEIYAQYLNKSLLKLFSNQYLEEQIYNKFLEKLTHEHPENPFLRDYAQLLEDVHELKEQQNNAHEKEVQVELNSQLKNAERSLKWMRRDFVKFMKNEDDTLHQELSFITNQQKIDLIQEITNKKLWSRLSWIVNIGAGLSCFLVGLEAAQTSIVALISHFGIAISGAALSASVFGIAIVGAIGYTFLIHHTVSQMIQDNIFKEWKKKIIDFFKKKPHNFKEGLKYTSIALGVSLVIGLSILATLATAGTWWYAAKAGVKMISWIAKFASPVRIAAVATMGVTSLAFNLTRSLESLKTLGKRLAELPKEVYKKYQEIRQQVEKHIHLENRAQLANPFRILNILISIPFKTVAFIGHLVSMAVMGDRIAGVPATVAAGINFFNEFFVDHDIIFPHHHHEQQVCQHHHEKKVEQESKSAHDHHHHHKHRHHHEAHDHQHINLIGKFLKYVLLGPLHLLEALWDYGFSQINKAEKTKLSFIPALKKAFFGLPPAKPHLPELSRSPATLLREQQNRVQKAKSKRQRELQKEQGNEIVEELEAQIFTKIGPWRAYMNENGTINGAGFFSGRTLGKATRKVCEKIIKITNDPQYNRVAPSA